MTLDQNTIDAISAYYATLPHTDVSADAASVQTFMASNANVVDSGGSSVLAWAEFADGIQYVFFLDENAPGSGATSAARLPRIGGQRRDAGDSRRRMATTNTSYTNITTSGPIYVLANMTAYGTVSTEQGISNALAAAGHPTKFENATIAALGDITNAAGLYVHTHGGIIADKKQRYVPYYALATSEIVPFNTATGKQDPHLLSSTYKTWLNLGVNVPDGAMQSAPRLFIGKTPGSTIEILGVSTEFFKQVAHLSFLPNAFVFMAACESDDVFHPSQAVPDFIGTFAAKGATSYLGWTAEVNTLDNLETSNFLFDRWAGESPATAGLYSGLPNRETPPERPFSLAEVFSYAGSFNRQTSGHGAETENLSCDDANKKLPGHSDCYAYLQSYSASGGNSPLLNQGLLLTPSLAFVADLLPYTAFLGEFDTSQPTKIAIGPKPGTAGATTMTVAPGQYLTATRLIAQLPVTGAGSAGYVTISSGSLSSNSVPLSVLKGLTYSDAVTTSGTVVSTSSTATGTGSLTVSGKFDLRMDVHAWRASPGATAMSLAQYLYPDPLPPDNGAFTYLPNGSLASSSGSATAKATTTSVVTVGYAKGDTSTFTESGSAALSGSALGCQGGCPLSSGFISLGVSFDATGTQCGATACASIYGILGVPAMTCMSGPGEPTTCTSNAGASVGYQQQFATTGSALHIDGQGNVTGSKVSRATGSTPNGTACSGIGLSAGSCTFGVGSGSVLYPPVSGQQG